MKQSPNRCPRFFDFRRKNIPLEKAVALSQGGRYSFAEAFHIVTEGRTTVNGKIVRDPSSLVDESALLCVDGNQLEPRGQMYYYLFYKPRKVLTACKHAPGDESAMSLVTKFIPRTCLLKAGGQVTPVGRLDFESEGLILLTNDRYAVKQLICD
jgi:23S rRNA pseudouridine2605 synthase